MNNKQPSTKQICRVAIYARYSSDMQSPESANDQISRLQRYVERQQINLVKYCGCELVVEQNWIVKDEAETGKVAGRDGYEKIIKGIKENSFEVLLVDDLSRLNRSLGNQITLYNLLRFKGIELFALCDGISSEAPNSKAGFQIKGVVNELSNDMGAMRTKRGQEARVLQGYSAGDVCFGYNSRPTQTRLKGGLEIPSHYEVIINEDEAKTINLVFDLCIKGLGYSAIAKRLNANRVPSTRRGLKITGKVFNWNATLVRNILLQEKYIGRWKWGRTTYMLDPEQQKFVAIPQPEKAWVEHHDGKKIRDDLIIVSIDKWLLVQEKIRSRAKILRNEGNSFTAVRKLRKPGLNSDAILAGILSCHECGSQFLQVTAKGGGYFGCYMHHRKDNTQCANKRLLSRKKIEARVVDQVKVILLNSTTVSTVTNALNKMARERVAKVPNHQKSLAKRLGEIEREIQNLIQFIMVQGDSSTTVKNSLTEREEQKALLLQQIKMLESVSNDKVFMTPGALRAKYEKLIECLNSDVDMGNLFMRKLFSGGLVCIPENSSSKRNHNQNNAGKWTIRGKMMVGGECGFSALEVGGGAGN